MFFKERTAQRKLKKLKDNIIYINYKVLKKMRETCSEQERKIIEEEIIKRTIYRVKNGYTHTSSAFSVPGTDGHDQAVLVIQVRQEDQYMRADLTKRVQRQ